MTQLELQEPDAKVLYQGTSALSDAEAIGLIIAGVNPTDKARELLESVDYEFNRLGSLTYPELKGMGFSHLQAIRLIAVMEFAHRKSIQIVKEKDKITCSRDILTILSPYLSDLEHEEFWVLYLNRSNKIIKKLKLSQGGLSGTVTDIRLLLNHALLCKASGLIVAHNHPSGNLNPSESDKKITQKIKEGSNIMDIQLLDHIIIAGQAYYSFADNGLV